MSPDIKPITRDNLNDYLKDLAKEFRKLNGKKTSAEIILIGGAAVLAGYGFRDLTYDVDAIIVASSAMKDAINRVGDKHGLPRGWLNADFKRTVSYSDRLMEVSVYYRTFSNIVTVRTVAAEYLLAMKLMSGRQYKNDLSDIVGILWEHRKIGKPISRESVEKAIESLYGTDAAIPETSMQLLSAVFASGDYETLYHTTRESELESKELLLEFEQNYPNALKGGDIGSIINSGQRKRREGQKDSMLAKLEEKKRLVEKTKQSLEAPVGHDRSGQEPR
ncbi:MAG: DUF6036 family nucleotidyltransferase [Oscillospiraceae bacterium]|nr:DUF6036 family nucleotidyltransferase [Oscillospiraceae bacterium]